jgi:hypothetical protein
MSNGEVTPPKSGLQGWLSNANNLVTAAGAIVAGIAAIMSTCNKATIEEINTQVKQLEIREMKEKASSEYANLFLDKVLKDPDLIKNEKRVQALLSILNIVAQASSSDTGNSDAKARAIMPFQLALLLGQPGGVAAMDTEYKYLDDWVAIASADNSNQTRVTAIQALGGVCQKALLEGRLDVLSKGVKAVDQLLALIPEEQAALRGSATAARAQLAFFIAKEQNLLAAAKLFDPRDTRDQDLLRSEIQNAFPDAATKAQETKQTLTATVAKLEDSSQPNPETIKEVKESLSQVNAALQTASNVTVAQAMVTPVQSVAPNRSPGSPAPSASPGPPADPLKAKVDDLVKDLTQTDPAKQAKARSELALFGQKAVKPLLELAKQNFDKEGAVENKALEGVAEALRNMRQPIQLDLVDAYWVVSMLRSSDQKARYDTAEFLMNLESGASVRNCFDALEIVFYELMSSPKEGGNTVTNIATIMGTWARNMGKDTPSRESGKSFPALAFETAKRWKTLLEQSPSSADWRSTITTLGELITRASARAK